MTFTVIALFVAAASACAAAAPDTTTSTTSTMSTTPVTPAASTTSTSSGVAAVAQQPMTEKESRTPAQQKISSPVLYEIYRLRGQAVEKQVPEGDTGVRMDAKKRALVDLRVEVTAARRKALESLGATIVSVSVPDQSIVAWVPLVQLEPIAEDPAVRAIEAAAEALTNSPVK